MAAISWTVLRVGAGWVPRGGAALGRMLGAGSGLPLAFQSFCRGKRQASRR